MPAPHDPSQEKKKPTDGAGKPPRSSWWFYIFLLAFIALLSFLQQASVPEITWQQFENDMLSRKAVDRIEVINQQQAKVYIKKNFAREGPGENIGAPAGPPPGGRSNKKGRRYPPIEIPPWITSIGPGPEIASNHGGDTVKRPPLYP
jgi:hypothetical protein